LQYLFTEMLLFYKIYATCSWTSSIKGNEVFTAVSVEFMVFCIVGSCSMMVGSQQLKPRRQRQQHGPLKHWCPITTLCGTTSQKTLNSSNIKVQLACGTHCFIYMMVYGVCMFIYFKWWYFYSGNCEVIRMLNHVWMVQKYIEIL